MFKSLLAIQWKSMFVSRKSKQGSSGANRQMALAIFAIILLVAVLSVPAVVMFQGMSSMVLNQGQEWVFWSMISLMSLFLGIISTIFAAYQLLFRARDSELLLSLPIPPKMILGVKVLNLYFLTFLVHSLLLFYASIGFLRAGGSLTSVFLAALLSLFLPLLILSLSSIFAILISVLARYIPFKNFFIFLLSLAGIAGYYYFVWVLSDRLGELLIAGINFAEAFRRVIPPMYAFGIAIQFRSSLHVLQFVLWTVIPFGIVFGLMSLFFRKLMTKKEATIRVAYKGKIERQKPLYVALVAREIRRLINLPMVLLNSGLGVMASLVLAGVLIVRRDILVTALAEFGDLLQPDMMSAIIGFVLVLLAFSNSLSASSLSLEGQQLWALKSLPIHSRDILLSKAVYAFVLGYPPILLTSIVYIAVFSVSPDLWLMLAFLPFAASVFAALLGVFLNVGFPKLAWQNETIAVKQSMSVFLHLMIGIAIEVIAVFFYFMYLRESVSPVTYAYVWAVFLTVLSGILYFLIVTKGVKLLDKIDA